MNTNSSYLKRPKGSLQKFLFTLYDWLCALTNPIWWILSRESKTILDVGCGQGYPMQLLKKLRPNLIATGVDLFDDYLADAKKNSIFEKLVKSDVTKMKFSPKSFDTVICLQVVEHQKKTVALKMIQDMEKFANKQVIIATPLGFFDHPDMDGNILQRHLSGWVDQDFKDLGYQVSHQSLNLFFGNNGLVHRPIPRIFKAIIFILDHLLTPIYFFFPKSSDYWIIAWKNLN